MGDKLAAESTARNGPTKQAADVCREPGAGCRGRIYDRRSLLPQEESVAFSALWMPNVEEPLLVFHVTVQGHKHRVVSLPTHLTFHSFDRSGYPGSLRVDQLNRDFAPTKGLRRRYLLPGFPYLALPCWRCKCGLKLLFEARSPPVWIPLAARAESVPNPPVVGHRF